MFCRQLIFKSNNKIAAESWEFRLNDAFTVSVNGFGGHAYVHIVNGVRNKFVSLPIEAYYMLTHMQEQLCDAIEYIIAEQLEKAEQKESNMRMYYPPSPAPPPPTQNCPPFPSTSSYYDNKDTKHGVISNAKYTANQPPGSYDTVDEGCYQQAPCKRPRVDDKDLECYEPPTKRPRLD